MPTPLTSPLQSKLSSCSARVRTWDTPEPKKQKSARHFSTKRRPTKAKQWPRPLKCTFPQFVLRRNAQTFPVCFAFFFWQSTLLHKSYFTMLLASRVRSILAICNWPVRKPYRQSHMDQSGFKLIPPTEKRWNNEKLLGFISQRQMSGILLWCSLKLTAYCHWTSRIIPINKW